MKPARPILTSALVGVATFAASTPAQAATVSPSSVLTKVANALVAHADPSCAAQPISNPFLRWGDKADYVTAPSGSFESGLGGWAPIGFASVVKDNEPWKVSGNASDSKSVALLPGSSLVSGSFCGGIEYPTVRMFTKATKGSTALALVTIRYTGKDGILRSLPLGVVTAGTNWQPSLVTLTASGVPLLTGTRLGVTITDLVGSMGIDDVYVDPARRS